MRTPDIKRKEKSGYGFVKYTSKNLNFTIFEDGSGYTEVLHRKDQIFVSESGTHKQRIDSIMARVKGLRKEADLLHEAAEEMKKYSYNTPT